MAALVSYADLRWWLVDHPAVSSFEWKEYRTWGASPRFLAATILAYLSLTFLLHSLLHRPAPPLLLRLVSMLHNLFILLLSLAMAAGCSLASLSQMPSARWLFCFPAGATHSRGPVFFWAYVFYLSKIYEFVDTLLILLAGAGARRRLSFLHVYHHAVVVVMCYVWLSAVQSLMPVALVTNAGVHVVMYSYYLCSSVGWRWPPRWKRVVTDCQIFQFAFSFAVSLVFLWLHFFDTTTTGSHGGGRRGCSGMKGWLFNAVFNASLLALFLDFHKTNYSAAAAAKKNKSKSR